MQKSKTEELKNTKETKIKEDKSKVSSSTEAIITKKKKSSKPSLSKENELAKVGTAKSKTLKKDIEDKKQKITRTTNAPKASRVSKKTSVSSAKVASSSTKKSKTTLSKVKKEVKKSVNNKTKKISKTSSSRKNTLKKVSSKSSSLANTELELEKEKVFENIPEYYDLPYAYNKTVVKVLYQNPTTLFVYWEISQDDVNHFKNEFGENFFYITKPVLVVHNITKNYFFEININDFANNWYITVDDAKCVYEVKLARKPSQSSVIYDYDSNKNTDFVEVSNSNIIEMPNDHVLFYKNGQKLYFKNIKNNSITEKVYKFKSKDSDNVKSIYKNYKLDEIDNRFDFRNPSSQNPTSNVM